MKKIISIILCMLLILSLAGCGANGSKAVNNQGDNTASFEYDKTGDSLVLTKYTGTEEVVFIPSEINGIPVTQIGENCFAGDIHVKKVHVPEGVTSIGNYAFECCAVLEKVYLPETLTAIGDGAFSGCGAIEMIDLQDQVEEIGRGAFLFCRELNAFHVPTALKTLGEFAFAGCESLYAIDLGSSQLTQIPNRAFYRDGRLNRVVLPTNLTEFGVRAFSHCSKLENIYFPEYVNHISSYAFENCENLTSVEIRGGDVEAFAFAGCYGMFNASFSDEPITLHTDAFANTGLVEEDLYIPENVKIEKLAFPTHEEYEMPEEGFEESNGWFNEEYNVEQKVSAAPAWDNIKTAEEILTEAKAAGYRVVSTDDFDVWADEYLEYNKDTANFERSYNVYTDIYKRQIENYYAAMTAAATKNPNDIATAAETHGDDFIPMYEMVNHGLLTEMKRFRMPEDMLLVTGVYDSQLMAAAGTDEIPTMEKLKSLVGTTFLDPCLTSTTNDINVAVDFSDTMFIIYAPADSLNALGAVGMDAYMRTFEKETLLYSGAEYEILDAGYFSFEKENYVTGNPETSYEKYVLVKLINK